MITDYKFPREYRVVKELPRNASGKILKNSLREQERGINDAGSNERD